MNPITPQPGERYFAYTIATGEDEARKKFEARYGYAPDAVGVFKGLIWSGPLRKPYPEVGRKETCEATQNIARRYTHAGSHNEIREIDKEIDAHREHCPVCKKAEIQK